MCSDSELMSNNTTINNTHQQDVSTRRSLSTACLAIGVSSRQLLYEPYVQHRRDTGDNPFSCVSLLKGSHCKLSFITKTSRSSTLRRFQQCTACTVCRHVYDSHGRYFSDAVCFHQLPNYLRLYMDYILRISLPNYHDEYLRSFNSGVAQVDMPCWQCEECHYYQWKLKDQNPLAQHLKNSFHLVKFAKDGNLDHIFLRAALWSFLHSGASTQARQ